MKQIDDTKLATSEANHTKVINAEISRHNLVIDNEQTLYAGNKAKEDTRHNSILDTEQLLHAKNMTVILGQYVTEINSLTSPLPVAPASGYTMSSDSMTVTVNGRLFKYASSPSGAKTLVAPVISSAVTSTTSIGLAWNIPVGGVTFTLQRATNNIFTQNLTSLLTTGSTATSYNDAGLTSGIIYFYRITVSAPTYYNTSTWGVTCNTPGNIVNLTWAGTSTLSIDCSLYASGTTLTVPDGTYAHGIDILNSNGHVIKAFNTGVYLDGLNDHSGDYNVLNVQDFNNVVVRGITTKNNLYYAGYVQGSNSGQNFGVTFDRCNWINNTGNNGIYFGQRNPSLNWVNTDATVYMTGVTRMNCTFDSTGGLYMPGGVNNGNVTNLFRNWVDAGNTFTNANPTQLLALPAIDYCMIYNNTINNINIVAPALTNDNRLYIINGYGDVMYNKCTNYQGHFAACWAVSYSPTVVKTSNFHHNICINSNKYSAYEFQEWNGLNGQGFSNITPYTTKSNLICDTTTCGNLNTIHDTSFDSNIIDSYMYGYMGGTVTVTNSICFNVFKTPTINGATGREYVSNVGPVTTDTNNKYVANQGLALDSDLNSLFPGIGAM